MYNITIKTGDPGCPPLKLQTENRNLARSCVELCRENKLECEVSRIVEPQPVKFKNL